MTPDDMPEQRAASVTDQSLNLPLDFATAAEAAPAGAIALEQVDRAAWQALCRDRAEGNGLFDPGFSLPAFDLIGGGRALQAFDNRRLTGLLPVISAWRALRLPIPMLVARQPYSVLPTPLLDAGDPVAAAAGLIEAAHAAGAAVLMIAGLPLDGPAANAIRAALAARGAQPTTTNIRHRAALDATRDAEDYLRAGFGARRLKELRRQGHRMAEEGVVRFTEATSPADIAPALDRFLALEASGWKGRKGSGLGQAEATASFIRRAAADLGARGLFSVHELWLGDRVIAAGTIVRQGDHALFFKIAFDEAFARFSPGVQLTVELTRRLCADPVIRFVDSTADVGHPMIDHVWRERLAIGDVFIPTGRPTPLRSALIGLVLLRRRVREAAKSLYHSIRSFREKHA